MWLEERHSAVELRNHSTGGVSVDQLFHKKSGEGPCDNEKVCVGSRMVPRQVPINYKRPKEKILQQAKEFLDEFFRASNKFGSEEHIARIFEVHKDIENRGGYDMTFDELEYGTRLAWRNAPRCIARIQWTTLKVFDARHVKSAREMFDSIIQHIVYATNQGRLRSVITIFPPRSEGQHDFRIWNSQLIGYAGYRNPDGTIKGDPSNVEITERCLALGWKRTERTQFDVLPIVLQANGQAPEVFTLPDEIVLQVPLCHPTLPLFEELGLKWYALPAVANMLFDCGGIQFPAAPFNGWYMGTEIGARDLCDPQRYNLSEKIAKKMGLDTSSNATLWKDTVLLEINKAVLHSYKKCGVTTWDHHTASESFMKFYASEMKTRGGCPADWIWLVPPISSSSSPLFHQEMALYFLKPSLEYQPPAWKDHKAIKAKSVPKINSTKKFKVAIVAVRFCVSFYRMRFTKRPKMVVLYASQSGKAEKFATETFYKFASSFQVRLYCMADFDVDELKLQEVILVVASTFGEGEAPTNGEHFKNNLDKLRQKKSKIQNGDRIPFFSVLGLGSTAYPQFCEFGKILDKKFQELGGQRLIPLGCADELNNQEEAYQTWITDVATALSKKYESNPNLIVENMKSEQPTASARFIISKETDDVVQALSRVHRNEVSIAQVIGKTLISYPHLSQGHAAVLVQLHNYDCENLKYQPGDHLALFPRNTTEMVDRLERRLKNCPQTQTVVQLQVQRPNQDWEEFHRIPPCSFDKLLTRFVDLTNPPNKSTLRLMASLATDSEEKTKLQLLARDSRAYNEWKSTTCTNVVEVLEEFQSVDVDAAAFVSTLSLLQPRYYSISSSASVSPSEIHITASLVRYGTQDGLNRVRRGLCTSYMEELNQGDLVTCYSRPTPSFRLPNSPSNPLIWIASGSGIAPFRGFWQHLCYKRGIPLNNKYIVTKSSSFWSTKRNNQQSSSQHGATYFYYGCRDKATQLFRNELDSMLDLKVINKLFMAYSRENAKSKVYVQDLLWKDGERVSKLILKEEAIVYVCGGTAMASQVEETLQRIIFQYGNLNQDEANGIVRKLKIEGRYKTDIFGTNSTD